MEVNDCHLQFFDSNSKLIYEFNLNDTIALNNGAGILIKDDLTTLTIDKNIVVDNLETTVDALITYIQEQRVLCNCCATTPEAVVSALWGYDSGTGINVFIKEYADGTESYESPIDTPYTPIGAISKTNTILADLTMLAVSTNSVFNTPGSVLELSITCQSGGGTFTINGVTYNSVIGFQKTYSAKVLGDGSVKKVPAFAIDGGGATTLIIEYTL